MNTGYVRKENAGIRIRSDTLAHLAIPPVTNLSDGWLAWLKSWRFLLKFQHCNFKTAEEPVPTRRHRICDQDWMPSILRVTQKHTLTARARSYASLASTRSPVGLRISKPTGSIALVIDGHLVPWSRQVTGTINWKKKPTKIYSARDEFPLFCSAAGVPNVPLSSLTSCLTSSVSWSHIIDLMCINSPFL